MPVRVEPCDGPGPGFTPRDFPVFVSREKDKRNGDATACLPVDAAAAAAIVVVFVDVVVRCKAAVN
ncbi:uroporphyrinogen III synthase HEM4 [Anopheles sinensis]|uniref:Uroporphyrinogen III synthase HEM4 n=1 Tax=Anopheles sinensis TaxID=74873 RepID=A0A084WUB0_ANOSI|nr:uroporphyrinogen III synthase HEM4 [Anopheles sinensis]